MAAARRAGRRGDGYFPGGRLTPEQRAEQVTVMRAEAAAAGRDPDALEYTRWGQTGMTAGEVQALASEGVTRLVVSPRSTGPAEMLAEISSFAGRLGLG
jgi:alkanesulfonate monooxygenase SsuD/methylene tetrahydromethanopterin reductase-like flavin-dependent oxidoreductase (luciferase family)